MKTQTKKIITGLVAVGFTLLCGLPAHADDTEIYVTPLPTSAQPNVLFIVDTSGSMGTPETITTPYDPNTTYTGSCDPSRIYWSTSGSPPSCSTSRYFPLAANRCAAAVTPLATTGFYIAEVAQWRRYGIYFGTRKWRDLSSSHHGVDDVVECKADEGVHGPDSSSSDVYADRKAKNSDNRWTNDWSDRYYSWDGVTLYDANYMNYYNSGIASVDRSRLWIVQDISKKLVASLNGVNIGLMRFDEDGSGGYVALHVDDIETNRSTFNTTIDSFYHDGNTPLSETLYEAALYWRGETPEYGLSSDPDHSVANSMSGGKYISPILDVCQKNNIVYLTDGEPTSDTGANTEIQALMGASCQANAGVETGYCLDDLAQWLYENDQIDVDGTETVINNVSTYTVGFHTDQNLLDDTAALGGGKYYTADSYEELNEALTSVFLEILERNALFTAPAVSVNAFNRLEHREELYFALFRPMETVRWLGNVKRYRFDPNAGDGGAIVDQLGYEAIDPNTGSFKPGARSFWSDELDGDNVAKGGMANEFALPRTVYTYTGAGAPNNVALSSHPLNESAVATLEPLMDLGGDTALATNVLKWARGVDLQDEDLDDSILDARPSMGDILHSRPQVIIYGGTAASPDATLFATSNEGYFHAVDTDDGSELFAFMPKELLPNLDDLYDNSEGGKDIYGLDGPMTLWTVNNSGTAGTTTDIVSSEGDFVYAYFGMRRGGKNYYSLDLTNRNNPILKWMIAGGVSGDFSEMGQTWSRMAKSKVRMNTTTTDVLIFAGGFDGDSSREEEYGETARDGDDSGRAIYIVNANTGALIWSGGTDDATSPETDDFTTKYVDMDYAIPSDIRVVDVNGDGLADILFVGDIGGQLWRFDIHNGASTAADLVTGGVIADFGGDDANNRRFFYPPSVALTQYGGDLFLALAIGSGWRVHPLDKVIDDRFYMVRQTAVYEAPKDADGNVTYTKLDHDDLYDATDNVIGQGTDTAKAAAITSLWDSKQGWYLNLEKDGEKSIADAVILNNQIVFTSYEPDPPAGSSCTAGLGLGYTYFVSLFDATPTMRFYSADNADLVKEDRISTLDRPGIPASPVVYFPPGGEVKILIGPEILPSPISNPTTRTSWVAETE